MHSSIQIASFRRRSFNSSRKYSQSEQMTARGMYIDSVASDETILKFLKSRWGTMVYRIQRIFYSGDNPLMFLNNYLRMDFFPNLDRWTEQFWNLYPFWFSIIIFSIRMFEYISAVSADLVDAQILHINPGVPLLNSRRIARCNLDRLNMLFLEFVRMLWNCVLLWGLIWNRTL